MNFRNCRYFLMVCRMGSIHAAARALYISPQSLSQHIRKMEEELDVQLFYRDNPLKLTDAGRCMEQAARDVLERMKALEQELSELKGNSVLTLTIGLMDYGIPDFLMPLIDMFIREESNVLVSTREISAGEDVPRDIPLLISARELGEGFVSEVLFTDRLAVCVSDTLLRQTYGGAWQEHRQLLRDGDLHALDRCPFVRHRNTPLEKLSETAFRQNDFIPEYVPVIGSAGTISGFCAKGLAAMVTFEGQAGNDPQLPAAYRIANMPESIPAGYICYRGNSVLPGAAQRFLNITRRYFNRAPGQARTEL